MGLIRGVILIGVAMLVYYFFAFNRWPVGGAIASVIVGAVVSFAVTFLFMNKAQAEASQQFRRALNRRKDETEATKAPKTEAPSDEDVEDAYLDAQEGAGRHGKADSTDLADR